MIGMESWFCSGAVRILVWGDNSQLEIKVVILRFHTFLEKMEVIGEEVVVEGIKREEEKTGEQPRLVLQLGVGENEESTENATQCLIK